MFEDVSRVISTRKASMTAGEREANKALFQSAEEALDKVIWARRVDHSNHIIDAITKVDPGIKVVTGDGYTNNEGV